MLSLDEDIKEYGIHYQIIERDGIVMTNTPIQEIVVPSSMQEYHFMNMLSNVLYEFSVFAINEDGNGVKTTTQARKFAITQRCLNVYLTLFERSSNVCLYGR